MVVVRASPRLVVCAGGEPGEALELGAAGVVQVRHHLGRDELVGGAREEEDGHADAADLPSRLELVLVEPRRDHPHKFEAEERAGNVRDAGEGVLDDEAGDLLAVLAARGDLDGDGAAERPPEDEDLAGVDVAPLREVVEGGLQGRNSIDI